MSNSSLATVKILSPNCTKPRNHEIDTISIHCFVGQVTAKQGLSISRFTTYDANSGASCNYIVGKDGSIGLGVDEANRSWCTSSRSNDNRAITIEVASDSTSPYKVTDAAYNALIELLVDICKRNNIKKLLWKADKSLIGQVDKQNMTVHRWFANKACPGDYLYNKHYEIAETVNKKLGVENTEETSTNSVKTVPYTVRVTASVLNIREGPSTSYKVTGTIRDKGVYTIVEVSSDGKWGKLKSGLGWISLNYTK
jgi:hypothetical protein